MKSRDASNICFVFTSMPNNGLNSLFAFGQIVKQDRIQIAMPDTEYMLCKAWSDLPTDNRKNMCTVLEVTDFSVAF